MKRHIRSFYDSFKPAEDTPLTSSVNPSDIDVCREELVNTDNGNINSKNTNTKDQMRNWDIEVESTSSLSKSHGIVDSEVMNKGLKRKLKTRHLQMIAVGGAIGTGLFVVSGQALSQGGPGSVLINFILSGIMVLFTVSALGELVVMYPIQGSYAVLISKFIDESLGFALTWNYLIQWLTVMPFELVVAGFVINYWKTDISIAVWITIFLFLIAFINIFGVKGYGEVEFFCSAIKTIAIFVFIIISIITVCGGTPGNGFIGAKNWVNPGAFNNGFKGFCSVFVSAAVSFNGTELVGLAAAETEHPQRTIPRAVKQVVWRVFLFYALSLFLIGLVVPYDHPHLLGSSSNYDASASPFVIVFEIAGLKGLPSVLNAVILISVLSVGNTCVFAATRLLAAMASVGHAPRCFRYIDRAGRPILAVVFALLCGTIAYIRLAPQGQSIFDWLLSLFGITILFIWLGVNVAHIRFRRAWRFYGKRIEDLYWVSYFGEVGSYLGALICTLALMAQMYVAISPINAPFTVKNLFQSYLAAPVVIALFTGHKIYNRGRGYRRMVDIELEDGMRKLDIDVLKQEKAELANELRTKSWFKRFLVAMF